jgi:hypothetical protein
MSVGNLHDQGLLGYCCAKWVPFVPVFGTNVHNNQIATVGKVIVVQR